MAIATTTVGVLLLTSEDLAVRVLGLFIIIVGVVMHYAGTDEED